MLLPDQAGRPSSVPRAWCRRRQAAFGRVGLLPSANGGRERVFQCSQTSVRRREDGPKQRRGVEVTHLQACHLVCRSLFGGNPAVHALAWLKMGQECPRSASYKDATHKASTWGAHPPIGRGGRARAVGRSGNTGTGGPAEIGGGFPSHATASAVHVLHTWRLVGCAHVRGGSPRLFLESGLWRRWRPAVAGVRDTSRLRCRCRRCRPGGRHSLA